MEETPISISTAKKGKKVALAGTHHKAPDWTAQHRSQLNSHKITSRASLEDGKVNSAMP